MADTPIRDLALLSDRHSAALVDRAGSVLWWCPPRFDAPSVFAGLLDDTAGHFTLRPDGLREVQRRYLDDTLVLHTTMTTATGTLELTDALALAPGGRGHDVGADSPHVLLRRAGCTDGHVDLQVTFAPRFEYGLSTPVLLADDDGLVARSGASQLRLSTDMALDLDGATAHGRVQLQPGDERTFAVAHASSWQPAPDPWAAEQVVDRLEDTTAAWRSWQAQHDRYDGPYRDLVQFSGRVLHALTYQPTGAVIAAPTTSLPEVVGGERNWDYRYSWVRDASLALDALWVAACPDEAHAFVHYLTTAASSTLQTGQLQIVFGIGGERDLSERELDHLTGWRDSRPVRVGNDAWRQRQLDVYGELLDAVVRLDEPIGDLHPPERRLLATLVDAAADRWDEPDRGLWELRGPARHHVHSKLMCWVALDRGISLADRLDAADRVTGWIDTRDRIRQTILDRGYDHDRGTFTATLDGSDLDAAVLTIPATGMLDPDDPRMLSTIDTIERELADDRGLIYRYRRHDHLGGDEGTFLLCTFWLARALAMAGRPDRARHVFERAITPRNDLDLLAEEVDPHDGALLGNFPQAFSHIGLIDAAWQIAHAETTQHDGQS